MNMQLSHDPFFCTWSMVFSGLVLLIGIVALLTWIVSLFAEWLAG